VCVCVCVCVRVRVRVLCVRVHVHVCVCPEERGGRGWYRGTSILLASVICN